MNTRKRITHNLLNIPGWRTERHVVVFESDDWGAIRMPSREVYDKLLAEGYRVDKNYYERNDSLAREDDLCALFDVLHKYKDRNGNHPIITANCAVANPDFEKIKSEDYQHYFYEPFTETLKRYNGCENSFELWKQGIRERVFMPQFHAREHLNVARWMHDLKAGNEDVRYVFDFGIMGLFPKNGFKNYYQVALDDSEYRLQPLNEVVSEGLDLFEKIFGFKSKTFIAPCYTWRPELENALCDKGVIGLQGMVYQRNPGGKPIRHFMGTKNKYEQIYTIRNCSFEPTQGIGSEDCVSRINYAFRWHKPAVISAHRMNFMGAINEVPTFAFAGSFIPNLRDPRPILEVLCAIKEDFKFIVYTSQKELVSSYQKRLGSKLEIRERITRDELLKVLRQCDFLLNIDNGKAKGRPSKLIDYALSGRPILSLNSSNVDKNLIDEFLSGDYSRKYEIGDVEQFNIKNVAQQFLDLCR